jgi:hypothetical protein
VIITMAQRQNLTSELEDETLSATILLRVTPTEKNAFETLARKDSRSLSAWVRLAVREKARASGMKQI